MSDKDLEIGMLEISLAHKTTLLDSCEKALEGRDQQIGALRRKATLWDAFTSLGRIRTLGWANLGEQGYQHIGFELWTLYGMPEDNYDFTESNTESLKNLEIFLDAWIKTNEET